MSRPRLLDLFCGAGGAAMGYHRAGFDVTGVDIKPQPHYPFPFILGDALEYVREHGTEYDAIHASPPCQAYSCMTRDHSKHDDLYQSTRDELRQFNVPWCIENVIGAPYQHGVMLCGSMFKLRVRRHRNFETRDLILNPMRCNHNGERVITVTTATDTGSRGIVDYEHSRHAPFELNREIMGMPWCETQNEIGLAIPPAYTQSLIHI